MPEALLLISEMMDYDTAMLAVDSVKEYRLPPEDEKRFARIRSKIARLDWEGIRNIIPSAFLDNVIRKGHLAL